MPFCRNIFFPASKNTQLKLIAKCKWAGGTLYLCRKMLISATLFFLEQYVTFLQRHWLISEVSWAYWQTVVSDKKVSSHHWFSLKENIFYAYKSELFMLWHVFCNASAADWGNLTARYIHNHYCKYLAKFTTARKWKNNPNKDVSLFE